MRRLAFLLLIAGLVASCDSSPTAAKSEYPKTIGNWVIKTEFKADWVGENSQQKSHTASGDTVILKEPGDQYLTLTEDTGSVQDFIVHFTDSTLGQSDSISLKQIEPRFNNSGNMFSWGSRSAEMGHDFIKIDFGLFVNCDRNAAATNLWVDVFQTDSTHYRSYKIKVEGIKQAINTLLGVSCF